MLGGVTGLLFEVKSTFRSFVLHLAAGVIFAVVAIELLPDLVERHNLIGTSIGFFAGLLIMLLIKHFSHKAEKKHDELLHSIPQNAINKVIPWALLVGIAVDIFIDGILLGVGFAAGQSEGILLCVALSLEIMVLGLVVSTQLKTEKMPKKKVLLILSMISLTFVVGAFAGSVMLSLLSREVLTYILAFGLSALMYLVTEELLVEAHVQTDTPLNTAVFFIGFFVFLIVAIVH